MNPDIFDFNGAPLRVVPQEGEVWFVASDVCRFLEIGNITEALRTLDPDDLGNTEVVVNSLGRGSNFRVVNESGLFTLIFKSRKPAAKAFKRWVTSEVLPSLRTTGSYSLPVPVPALPPAEPPPPPPNPFGLQLPTTFAEALRLAADAVEGKQQVQRKLAVAEEQLEEAAPKIETYEKVMSGFGLFTFREVAAQLAERGLGACNLVARLMELGVLYRTPASRKSGRIAAKQWAIDRGYFKAIEKPYEVKDSGEHRIGQQVKVTPVGVEYIARKLGLTRASPAPGELLLE